MSKDNETNDNLNPELKSELDESVDAENSVADSVEKTPEVETIENTEDPDLTNESDTNNKPEEVEDVKDGLDTEDLFSNEPSTNSIQVSDLDSVSADYYAEEHNNKPKSNKFKFILAIVVFLVIGAVIGTVWLTTYNNSKQVSYIKDDTTQSDSNNTGEVLDNENVTEDQMVEAIITDTTDVLAIQLADQYGQDALGEMKLATGVQAVDGDGKTANVRLATIFDVPLDFNIQGSKAYFTDAINAFDGEWTVESRNDVPPGFTKLDSIRMWDTVENPSNPVVVTINYFQAEGQETYTITVETAIYP